MSVIVTGRPLFCLRAFLSAVSADALGLTVNVTVPGAAAVTLPLAKTIADGRHLPLSFT